jgi:uncharacterized repeat protein (TIGR03803 family)
MAPGMANNRLCASSPTHRGGSTVQHMTAGAITAIGTTAAGGASDYGTVFKLTPPAADHTVWSESLLHAFAGGSDGAGPEGVVEDSSGVIYGATSYGGTSGNNGHGWGAVYQIVE